jgi:YidC/Oxa1 family membrane protein insertase
MILFQILWKGDSVVNKNTIIAFALILLTVFGFQKYEEMQAKKQMKIMALNQKSSISVSEIPKQGLPPIASIQGEKIIPDLSNKNDTVKAQAVSDTIWIENEKILCGISTIGAKIVSLKMKEYGYKRTKEKRIDIREQVDLVANAKIGGGNLNIDGKDYDDALFSLNDTCKRYLLKGEKELKLTFICVSSKTDQIIKQYSFNTDSYKIGFSVSAPSLQGKNVTVGWKGGVTESETFLDGSVNNTTNSYINEQRKVHIFDGKSIEHIQFKKTEKKEETGTFSWAAVTSKYFMIAIVPEVAKDADITIDGYDAKEKGETRVNIRKQIPMDYSLSIKRLADNNIEKYWIFAGPTQLTLLRSFKNSFQKVLFGGYEWMLWANVWFPIICEYTLLLLLFIVNLVKDYGVTIILLTIILKIITFPLSHSSMKSMNKIKMLQPKLDAIRSKYGKNPKKMNEEIMAMYKEEGVNPLNPGCLPMFLQMPVLIALFVVLQKAIELRGAVTWMIPWVKDLSQPEILVSLKQLHLDTVFPTGIPMYGYGIALMPILMAILTFVQNKMTIKDPNQKAMIYFMPIFMLVLFNNFPAGLVFYWTLSNGLGIIQQYILNKTMEKEMAISTAKVLKPAFSGKKNK